MSDWLSMEQKVTQSKAEAKALGDRYLDWQPPRRKEGLLARLSSLLRRRPRRREEQPQPTGPAFR